MNHMMVLRCLMAGSDDLKIDTTLAACVPTGSLEMLTSPLYLLSVYIYPNNWPAFPQKTATTVMKVALFSQAASII